MQTCLDEDCCKSMAHTMELKACKNCKQAISGWNCTLCDTCSNKLGQCGHCRSTLFNVDETSTEEQDGTIRRVNSVVECRFYKAEVAGSSPAPGTNVRRAYERYAW